MDPNRLQVFHTDPKPARSSHLLRLIRSQLIETEVMEFHNITYHHRLTNISPLRLIADGGRGWRGLLGRSTEPYLGNEIFFTKQQIFLTAQNPNIASSREEIVDAG